MPDIPPSPEVTGYLEREARHTQRRTAAFHRVIIELVADGRLGTEWLRKLL